MASKSPRSSPRSSPDESIDRNLRSRKRVNIERRRSIHENSPIPERTASPIRSSSPHQSHSPVREREKSIYPDLSSFDCEEYIPEANNEYVLPRYSKTPVREESTKDSPSLKFIILIIIVIVACLFTWSRLKSSSSEESLKPQRRSHDTLVDCSQFMKLSNQFPHQDVKLFKSLKSGIETVYNRDRKKASVVTFFSTDQKLLDDFLTETMKISKSCINQSQDPIILKNSDLNTQKFIKDNTKIIEDYKDELIKRTIMVIQNVDQVSIETIPSLHSFTDTYNPLVAQSLIYMTIKVPQEPRGKAIDYIHSHLKQQWSDLSENVRGPLITRILDQAFYLKTH